MENTEKPKKNPARRASGPIRWGAIVPFAVIVAITYLYMHFFFDGHLRRGIQWGLTKALGVEVNVALLETSFWDAHLRVAGIEITDGEKPKQDSISIGEVRFGMLWDALLRAKIVVNEAVVERIEFGKPRATPGWVKPPEPLAPASNKPGMVDKVKSQALNEVQNKYEDNVFGDLASILGGTNAQVQLDKIQESLDSKRLATELEARIKAKQTEWTLRLKTLPQGSDFNALNDRLKAVKTKDFKSPQELQDSLQKLEGIFKDADSKIKTVQSARTDLDADLAKINADVKGLEAQIKADIKSLETRFKIPRIDAKALTMALLHKQIDSYLNKIEIYKSLAEKYLPPNLLKKGTSEPDPSIQPRPRAKGLTYEFGRLNSYPLVWIKRTAISSQAGFSPYSGTVKGEILDLTTNQVLTGRPTVADVAGDFPGMGISGFSSRLTIDNRKSESLIEFLAGVKSYAIQGRDLIASDDVHIAFAKAIASMGVKSSLKGLRDLDFRFENQFQNVEYEVASKNATVDSLLKSIFKGLPNVTMDGKITGHLPSIDLDANSNLGPELQKGLEREVNAKIAEARAQIEKYVNGQVAQTKAQIDAEVLKIRTQVDGQIKQVQAQADTQKKQVEVRADQAKKDAENQAKKGLEKEAGKAVDDLKKRFGF